MKLTLEGKTISITIEADSIPQETIEGCAKVLSAGNQDPVCSYTLVGDDLVTALRNGPRFVKGVENYGKA